MSPRNKRVKNIDNTANNAVKHKELVSSMSDAGFSFVGSKLNFWGDVRIDLHTMYRIGKTNKMAGAYIEKIANMVWRYGFELYDEDDNLIDVDKDKNAKEVLRRCRKLFRAGQSDNKTFDIFCLLYFTHMFSSGEVSIIPNKINDFFLMPENWRLKLLDTRAVKKKLNEYGDVTMYEYQTKVSTELFSNSQVVNYIGYPDIDNTSKGLSKFNRIYMEALSNFEANSRQMYFFKNNAMPNVVVMMDPDAMGGKPDDVKKKINDFKDSWDVKYKGNWNQGKPLVTSVVKDIKVLDASNVDMDLLSLRKENDKDFAVIFLMDTRLIGISKDVWSYGEVESTTIRQGNDQIEAYGEMMSETLNLIYRKFVDPNLPYTIKTKNALFTNENKDKEIWLREVETGVRTPNNYITTFGTWIVSTDPEMENYRKPKQAINNGVIPTQ